MEAKHIASEINNTFSEVEQVFASISNEAVNIVPFKDSWTAAQLMQHIILSVSGFNKMMNDQVGESKANPEALKERVKKDFLDFNTKMKSPDFIVPEQKVYKKVELLQTFRELKRSVIQTVSHLDLAKTCLSFELPVYGFLSRAEAAYFVLYHTQRHLHQLENINKKLVDKVGVK